MAVAAVVLLGFAKVIGDISAGATRVIAVPEEPLPQVVLQETAGRGVDAAVITAGFAGLGLGATPVAIANMNAITGKYGPSFKAFLVVPLVGAFFIDLLNAVIIKFFLGLQVVQSAPLPGA